MIWVLFVTLATGESGPVPVSRFVCETTATEIAAGSIVAADLETGEQVRIIRAACLGPSDVDPCEMEAGA